MRDAARSAGKTSGKTYSDELSKSLRQNIGKSSGFAKALSGQDAQIFRQWQKTGKLSSEAYATAFEKDLVPRYRKAAKRLVDQFNTLKFDPLNGVNSEMRRIFGNTEDVEGALRKVKAVIDELQAGRQAQLLPRDFFDTSAVTKLGRAIKETLDTKNWELLTQSQIRLRDEMFRAAEAAEAQEATLRRRNQLLEAALTPEARRTRELLRQQQATQIMLADRVQHAGILEDELESYDRMRTVVQQIRRDEDERIIALGKQNDVLREQQARFDRIFESGGTWGQQTKDFDELREHIRRTDDAMQKHRITFINLGDVGRKVLGGLKGRWEAIDNDIRLVIGLIASAADQVAVLGSALGAGLLGGGAAITTALGGVIGFAVAVGRLTDDLLALPAALRPAATALQGFTETFGRLRDSLVFGASQGLTSGFLALQTTLDTLTPATEDFGKAIGDVFASFATSVQPGTRAFGEINKLIETGARLLPQLADATGIWALGLITGLRRAAPLAEQLFGWVEKLGIQFEEFTRSSSFIDWISQAQTVFSEFGALLETTARTLNSLSTPAALERTVDLLRNLTDFMPDLGAALDVLGRLDIIGILAEALAGLGDALAPILPALGQLADVLRDRVFVIIEAIVPVLTAASTALAPFVEALAGLVAAVPPAVWSTLAAAMTAYLVAVSAFKGVTAVTGIVTKLSDGFGSLLDTLSPNKLDPTAKSVQSLSDKIKGLGTAGVIGAAVVGALALTDAAKALADQLADLEDITRDLVGSNAGLSESVNTLNGSAEGAAAEVTDLNGAFKELSAWNKGNIFTQIVSSFSEGGQAAHDLNAALGELDKGIQGLPLDDQKEKFQAWAKEAGASKEQILQMLDSMPLFKAQLEQAAAAAGQVADDQTLFAQAMQQSKGPLEANVEGLQLMATNAKLTQDQVSDLADQIRNFNSTTLDSREASRAYQEAIDDLTQSLADNGTTLDIGTEKGRANQAAIDDLVKSTLDKAAATLEDTGNQKAANKVIDEGRVQLIKQLEQFGLSKEAARKYVDQLLKIPEDTSTTALFDVPLSTKNNLVGWNKALASIPRNITTTAHLQGTGGGAPIAQAMGGINWRPTYSLTGEDGPEAIVPLRRSLSRVDPSVRELSAIAQGKSRFAAGGVVGAGRQVTVAQGAIQIFGDQAPETTATTVVNRIAERIG